MSGTRRSFLVIINDKTMKTRVVLILAICFSLFNFVVLAQTDMRIKLIGIIITDKGGTLEGEH